MQNENKVLQRYVHFVQCIHKTHSQHVKKMQGNIRIVLTLSILKNKKNKNTVTTDWIENKINKVYHAYLCFIEFKVGSWSKKKTKTSWLCFVLFASMIRGLKPNHSSLSVSLEPIGNGLYFT